MGKHQIFQNESPAPEMGQERKNRLRRYVIDKWAGLSLCLPSLFLVFVFKVYPLVRGVYLSLTSQEVIGRSVFIGLKNYDRLLSDEIFLTSLLNILKGLTTLPVFVFIPLVLAFLIHQGVPGWKFFRATYLFSYLLAPVMVGYMFTFLLSPYGPINTALKRIGLEVLVVDWLGNPKTAIFTVFAVIFWSWFGLGTVIYLAGMATIEEDLYESARLDGANSLQVLIHVTIPHMLPTISYWSVLVMTSFLIGIFPFIYALTEGGPGYASMVPEYYVYLVATRFLDSGYASTLGVVLFLVTFGLSMVQLRLMYLGEAI